MTEDAAAHGASHVASELVRLLGESIRGTAEVTTSIDRTRIQQSEDHKAMVQALQDQTRGHKDAVSAQRELATEVRSLITSMAAKATEGPSQDAQDRLLNSKTKLYQQITALLVVAAGLLGGGYWMGRPTAAPVQPQVERVSQ